MAAFQRFIDTFIQDNNLQGTIAYLDDVTIIGNNKEEHDRRLKAFMSAAKSHNLTINNEKSVFNVEELKLLGHVVSHGEIRPDPDSLAPLVELKPPANGAELKRCIGMFSYFSKWIVNFSEKLQPLLKPDGFPLRSEALLAFEDLKTGLRKACLGCIREGVPFVVECDASDYAVAAVLSQGGRPVAFLSRTLSKPEKSYPAIEKEAAAILEEVRKWGYLLHGNSFKLVTDQKALSFIFQKSHKSKIKNTKLQLWRLELSSFNYYIQHRPGDENLVPDALSRVCHLRSRDSALRDAHVLLGHPGVTRLMHFVRSKNLPFSATDVREECRSCPECARIKPRFYKPKDQFDLVKATRPMERISINFKGPVEGKNRFLLVMIDEYSRFPFAFPCKDTSAATVITCLSSLFSLAGVPAYIHSDRSMSFLAREVREFLHKRGVATSSTTPYHPTGNSQCERVNQTLWRTVKLLLSSRDLPEEAWEVVLPDALHSIRSLLCTSTNETPHERFFGFPRRSTFGQSVPDWLLKNDSALLRKYVRTKSEPLCEKVELVEANSKFALIRYANGKESTVSVRDLAPCPEDPKEQNDSVVDPTEEEPAEQTASENGEHISTGEPSVTPPRENSVRHSARTRKPPERYGHNICD